MVTGRRSGHKISTPEPALVPRGDVDGCQSDAHVSELPLSLRVGEMIAERFRNV